jgi:predicted transcriptional regulator of viral defense system
MKYRLVLLEQLKSLPFFDKAAVRGLSEPFRLKSPTVDASILRSIRHKEIIPLRKGLYVTAAFYDQHRADVSYIFFLANVIRKPSYVSSWTALQYHNLSTEAIRSTISVTSKVTRDFATRLGTFSYHSIKPDLFRGFSHGRGTFDFYIASPAKALFDLLYFRTRQFSGVTLSEIPRLVKSLRIDIDEMDKSEQDEFHALIMNWVRHE